MPDLLHTLQGHDLGFLRMIASSWGVELSSPDSASALPILINEMRSPVLARELAEALPQAAQKALDEIIDNGGEIPWVVFSRHYGDIRIMGAARRDRERPDLKPASPAEVLWYRGLIGRTFLDRSSEPIEYVYIPEELLNFLTDRLDSRPEAVFGRPATPGETFFHIKADDSILDHICTVLAGLRTGQNPKSSLPAEINLDFLLLLCKAAQLVNEAALPVPDNARKFLEAPRATALSQLAQTWLESKTINDLRLLTGLRFEGEWDNDPLLSRQNVLAIISCLPQDKWWNINAFIAAIHERQPDFQRPAGDYASWFIREDGSESYLSGFSSWEKVEGKLLRFFICGPLHWLGIFDLASPAQGESPTAFRPSRWSQALWHGKPPAELPLEKDQIRATADGRLALTRLTPRWVRYQVARFCLWEKGTQSEYRYRITPSSLENANQQGLRGEHLVRLLRKFSLQPLPPNLPQAVERWERLGSQAKLSTSTLLQVSSPDILEALRQSRAARFLGAALNPTTIIVHAGGEESVQNALLELGYLADFQQEKQGRKNSQV